MKLVMSDWNEMSVSDYLTVCEDMLVYDETSVCEVVSVCAQGSVFGDV